MRRKNGFDPRLRTPQAVSCTTYSGIEGVPRCRYDGDKQRATGEELQYIILIYVMYRTARGRSGRALEQRLRLVPGAWRMWRSAVGMMGRAVDAIMATLPGAQLDRVDAMGRHGRVDINLPRAADCGGDRMIVDTRNFIAVMEAAMEGTCKLCFRQGREVAQCPLQRALAVEAAPKTWETASGCVYRDIAMGNGLGEMTETTKI